MTDIAASSKLEIRAPSLLKMYRVEFSHGSSFHLSVHELALSEGEFLGILGPNGSGKSTFLRLVAGLANPLGGVVYICGKAVDKLPARERARLVAWVPQRAETPFEWTVREMVAAGRHPHLGSRLTDRAKDRDAVEQAIQAVGLSELERRPVSQLSGGEWQRSLIARALAQEARLLLLDEPVANLDLGYQRQIYELAVSLTRTQGIGIIAADHHVDLQSRYCNRLLLLDHGEVRAQGAPREVLVQELLEAAFRTPLRVDPDPVTGRPIVQWRFET